MGEGKLRCKKKQFLFPFFHNQKKKGKKSRMEIFVSLRGSILSLKWYRKVLGFFVCCFGTDIYEMWKEKGAAAQSLAGGKKKLNK